VRTLLFVQNGDGRPKCVPCSLEDRAFTLRWMCPPAALLIGCDCWWLVECENADDGRNTIWEHEHGIAEHHFSILASGGRE